MGLPADPCPERDPVLVAGSLFMWTLFAASLSRPRYRPLLRPFLCRNARNQSICSPVGVPISRSASKEKRSVQSKQLLPLLRTLSTTVDPRLHQLACHFLTTRRRFSAFARIPAPGDQVVLRNVLFEQCEISASIAILVSDLTANLCERFAFPRHRSRSESPARMPWNAFETRGRRNREISVRVT
jgi:hypothetical protein